MRTTIDARNVDILKEFFNDLSVTNQKKVLLAGFRKAARPLVKTAKMLVPQDTGRLMKSIGTMAIPREAAILVGAKKPKGFHGHFTESGTVQRKRKSGGRTGKVRGTKWFETAFELTHKEMYSTIDEEFYQSMNRLIIRTNKKFK